jgi:hypothetical protein
VVDAMSPFMDDAQNIVLFVAQKTFLLMPRKLPPNKIPKPNLGNNSEK